MKYVRREFNNVGGAREEGFFLKYVASTLLRSTPAVCPFGLKGFKGSPQILIW